MEKHAAKRRREEDGPTSSMDIISELPQHILQHILSLLSQKEAIQTSVLSKSWRYTGPTRPNIEFRENCFKRYNATLLSVLDKTLQTYHDRKVPINDFIVEIRKVDSGSIPLLEKWIPIVILNMGVNKSNIKFPWWNTSPWFTMPSVIFKAKFLKELYLEGCKLNQINALENVMFKHLQTLSLTLVDIEEETFHKIMSSCPLIQHVTLNGCKGLKDIKVNNTHNLKYFFLNGNRLFTENDGKSIEIDVPSLESFYISGIPNWFRHHKCLFPYLKSLFLEKVRFSKTSFDSFSSNCPCLLKLSLFYCHGFDEFQLSSSTIKRLLIVADRYLKAAIDAPSLLCFKFRSKFLPSISFSTTSSEWKSNISLEFSLDFSYDASSWFRKLKELYKALSQSEISLTIFDRPPPELGISYGGFDEPIVVENLSIRRIPCSSLGNFLNCLFRVCRPRYVDQFLFSLQRIDWEGTHKQDTEFLLKILSGERERSPNLEEVSMEAFDANGKQWHPFEGEGLSEFELPNNEFNQKVRCRLKWREAILLRE